MPSQADPSPPKTKAAARWRTITLLALPVLLLTFVHLIIGITAKQYLEIAGTRSLGDFDVFHLAGRMSWEGQVFAAYDAQRFFDAQALQWSNSTKFLWAYPPQFNFVAAALALLPPWLAYLIFTEGTLTLYLMCLKGLSRSRYLLVVTVMFPFLLLNARTGQNGFLTGALVGWFLLSFQRSRWSAGIPLGLMVIKPHLAIGIAALSLVSRRWRVMAVAALVVAATSLAATLAFGAGIWGAFLHGLSASSDYLDAGEFQLHRMTSLFAALKSLGLPSDLAITAQVGLALLALGGIVAAWLSGWRTERVLGLTALASILISPYNHDYDLAIYGLAVALLIDDLIRFATRAELLLLFGMSWALLGYGTLATLGMGLEIAGDDPASIAAFLAISAVVWVFGILWRAERAEGRPREWPVGRTPDLAR